jgi:hypothetical protein
MRNACNLDEETDPVQFRRRLAMTMAGGAVLSLALIAQERAQRPAKRARPPQFDSAKASQYFFDDVFTKLVGARPATGSASTPAAGAPGAAPAAGKEAATSTPAAGAGWMKLISAATIEDEIKLIKQDIDKNVTTPSDFAGRGHKVVRREFSMLAALFAIVAEYDGDVRFKKDAATARNLFARTANNAKAGGNANVFNEAKLRKTDLDELLSGSSLTPSSGEAPEWAVIIDRSPLMQRLELCFQGRLSPTLANQGEFAKNGSSVVRGAELIAALANVLAKAGMPDSDDETYTGFARGMRDAAGEIVEAVKLKNYDQARAAAGKIDKACSQCHESYR